MEKNDLQRIVAGLVVSGVLEVQPHVIKLHKMQIPSDNLLFFHFSLSAALNGDSVTNNCYTTEVFGQSFRVSDNQNPDNSIILNRKLATELYEVFDYFLAAA